MIVASSDDMTMPSTTVTDHSEVLPSGNRLSPPLSKGFEKREEIALLSTTAQADYIAGEVPRSITDDAFLQNKDPSFEDQRTIDDSRPRISSLDGTSSAPRVPSVLNGTDTDANLRDQNSELHGQRDNRGANQDAVPTKTISFSDSPMEHTRDEEMKDSPLGINVNEEDGCTSIPAIGTNTSNDVTTMVEQRIVSVTNQSTHDQEPSRIEPEGATLLAAKHASRRFDDEMLKEVLLEEQLKIVSPVEADRKDLDLKEPQSIQEDHDHEQEEVEVASKEPPGTPAKLLNESHENGLEEETKLQVVEPPSPEIIEVPQQIEHYQPYSPFDTYSHRSAEYPRNYHVSENGLVAVSLAGPSPAPPPAQSFESNRQISPIPRAPIAAAHHTIMRSTSVQRTSIGTSDGNQHNGILYSQAEVGIPHLPALVLPAHSSHVSVPAPAAIPATGFPAINAQNMTQASNHFMNLAPGGKRRIHLRLVEDRTSSIMKQPEKSGFLSFRRRSILRNPIHSPISEMVESSPAQNQWIDHGSLTVSWYEGTSSLELQEHVRNSVSRKLGLKGSTKLADFRVLDESTDPPEEIVLCAYIPNGSRLLLRFTTKDSGDEDTPTRARIAEYYVGPPESPSAAPSPHPTSVDLEGLGLNANQLALLGDRLKGLQLPLPEDRDQITRLKQNFEARKPLPRVPSLAARKEEKNASQSKKDAFIDGHEKNSEDDEDNSKGSHMEVASLHPEDQIQKSLREITDILMAERSGGSRYAPRQEKRQVIFVLANYFVLFLSLIAISAEIQARAPTWHATMERQLQNVQDCSKDQESLFRCVENGDLAGLVASVLLWISRSAATKRIFLFGFESPKRLWTVVYESLVTAVCWGFSYMFIRRGMNPDTNRNFLQKYWKDAVYGSLAGFNAAFMKHVLKNLIPQEAIEDALQERQLKILSWLPSFSLK